VKVPQGIWTFVKRLKDPKLFGEILDKDAVEGRVLPMYTHVRIKCWQLLHLTYDSKKSSWKTSNRVAHAKKVHLDDPDCAQWVSKQTSTKQKTINVCSPLAIFVCVQCVERVCLTCFCPGADAASSPGLQSMVVLANARLLTKMGRV